MIAFTVLQTGQVNRISHPDLVPVSSGFNEFFVIESFFLVFSDADQNDIRIFLSGRTDQKGFVGYGGGLPLGSDPSRGVLVPKPFMII
jgi:hypothetical protein